MKTKSMLHDAALQSDNSRKRTGKLFLPMKCADVVISIWKYELSPERSNLWNVPLPYRRLSNLVSNEDIYIDQK